MAQAIARAQTAGDPGLPRLEAELEHLQREAEAVRELSVARPSIHPNPFHPEP